MTAQNGTHLAVVNPFGLSESQWNLMRQQAEVLVKSGFLPKGIDTPEKVITIMMVGQELGLGPMAAVRGIDVIQGTPALKPALMLALIYRSKQLEDLRIEDDGRTCTVTMKRVGLPAYTDSFSMDDADRMMTSEWENGKRTSIPLSQKYNWKQMPKTMRKWRAISAVARVLFEDVILGLYTVEELGADVLLSESGDVIEHDPNEQIPFQRPAPAAPPSENTPVDSSRPSEPPAVGQEQAAGADVPDAGQPFQGEIDGYRRELNEARVLGIDLAPFELDASTATAQELDATRIRLRTAIEQARKGKAQQPSPTDAEPALPAQLKAIADYRAKLDIQAPAGEQLTQAKARELIRELDGQVRARAKAAKNGGAASDPARLEEMPS